MEQRVSGNLSVLSTWFSTSPFESQIDGTQVDSVGFDLEFDDPLRCPDRICAQCGGDHDFRPVFNDVKTSIETTLELLRPKKNTITDAGGCPK